MQPGPIHVDDEFLVAPGVRFLALQNELPAGTGEIRLRILAAKGQLPDVAEMHLP